MTRISNIFSPELSPPKKYLSRSACPLIIIDSAVEDLEVLKAGFEPGAEVVVLHPQLNGIEQITALVSRRKNLQKVHLISHGSPGSLKLGASELNLDNIDDRATEIETWFANSSDRQATSLFIYGCQVAAGEEGERFVQRLHQLTDANIAAATQIVGSCDRGGVWQLDYTVGAIDSETVFSQELIETYSGTFMEPLEQEQQLLEEESTVDAPVDAPVDALIDELPVEGEPEAEVDTVESADVPVTEPPVDALIDELPVEGEPEAEVDTVESADIPVTEPPVDALIDELPVEGEPEAEVDTVESADIPVTEPLDAPVESISEGQPLADAPVIEPPVIEPPVIEPSIDGEPVDGAPVEGNLSEQPVVDIPLESEQSVEPFVEAETTVDDALPILLPEEAEGEIALDSVIDLSTFIPGETVFAQFDVSGEAGFNNTADFYEVSSADGSVIDPDSGETVAVGDEGYAEAALANRLGLELTNNGSGDAEFSTELEGGKIYAPVIASDSGFDVFADDNPDNDPAIYFTYSDANADGFDHVRNSEPNVFEFEDLPDGGDSDFNDLVVSTAVALPSVSDTPDAPVEDAIAEEFAPVAEAVDEFVPEDAPVEDAIAEEFAPVAEAVDEFIPEDAPVEEFTPEDVSIEEAIAEDAPIVAEDSATQISDSSSGFNLDGTELQLQVFSPNVANPSSVAPTIVLDSNEPEFSSNGIEVDIAGGVAGDLSVSFAVDDNSPATSNNTLYFGEYLLSDVSDNLPAIEDVSLNESTTTLGLDASDITFTEDTIQVSLEGVTFDPGATALLDVDLAEV